jgi:lipopolysaccharide transport system ATP-binding protein
MSEVVIKVENLGKQYRLGQVGTGTLSHDLNRWWHKVRGNEDPYLKVGDVNDRTTSGESDLVWALKDINFEVKQGEVLGIIGKNGAGKSTLLKILSQVTGPTVGEIKVKGRIASLLEVGTGFHPELTGRENIFLNGAILGMTKAEIRSKFDEIVAFSGVERYIDTPVKRYSSGMYVRLAFAVAAHLEPEILIVDEVLAVGDAEFQKKCLGKMKDVSEEGRTVLFVSHNLGAVANLCSKGLLLNHGQVKHFGEINETLKTYTLTGQSENSALYKGEGQTDTITEVRITDDSGKLKSDFSFNGTVNINLSGNITDSSENIELGIRVIDHKERPVFTTNKLIKPFLNDKGVFNLRISIPNNLLVPNTYKLVIALHTPNKRVLSYIEEKVGFTIEETGSEFHLYSGKDYGCVFIDCNWKAIE